MMVLVVMAMNEEGASIDIRLSTQLPKEVGMMMMMEKAKLEK